jgi:hypothetical protein
VNTDPTPEESIAIAAEIVHLAGGTDQACALNLIKTDPVLQDHFSRDTTASEDAADMRKFVQHCGGNLAKLLAMAASANNDNSVIATLPYPKGGAMAAYLSRLLAAQIVEEAGNFGVAGIDKVCAYKVVLAELPADIISAIVRAGGTDTAQLTDAQQKEFLSIGFDVGKQCAQAAAPTSQA